MLVLRPMLVPWYFEGSAQNIPRRWTNRTDKKKEIGSDDFPLPAVFLRNHRWTSRSASGERKGCNHQPIQPPQQPPRRRMAKKNQLQVSKFVISTIPTLWSYAFVCIYIYRCKRYKKICMYVYIYIYINPLSQKTSNWNTETWKIILTWQEKTWDSIYCTTFLVSQPNCEFVNGL